MAKADNQVAEGVADNY